MNKTKYIFLFIIMSFFLGRLFGQQDSLLFQNDSLQIYQSSATFNGELIYNANNDLKELIEKEETKECEVDYSFYYNPLSLVANYYSYEFGEGGIIACGVPGSSLGVQTIDLTTGKSVSLTAIFTEEIILQALRSDQWIKSLEQKKKIDFSKVTSFKKFLDTIYQLDYVKFPLNSFAIYKYSKKKELVAIRLVGNEYMGFNHNRHFQLGLWLKPKPNFEKKLQHQTKFLLGKFKNGLIKE